LIVAKEANGIANPLEAYKKDKDGIEVLGQYQMNRHALVDAGFKNADGSWKEGNALGIKSDEEFLRGPNAKAAQDAAFEAMSRRNEQQIRSMGLDKKIGSKIDGIKAKIEVTETGLAAAAHRSGAGSVQKYFKQLEEHGWDSKKAVDALSKDERGMYLAVETRLREFANVGYRTQKPDS
jgi:maltoporin